MKDLLGSGTVTRGPGGWIRELERDKDGRIKMGVADPDCDDAKTNLSQSID